MTFYVYHCSPNAHFVKRGDNLVADITWCDVQRVFKFDAAQGEQFTLLELEQITNYLGTLSYKEERYDDGDDE